MRNDEILEAKKNKNLFLLTEKAKYSTHNLVASDSKVHAERGSCNW